MKKTKFYFKHNDSSICKTRAYFDSYMDENNLSEIEVYEAEPEILGGGVFWCKKHKFCGDDTTDSCGKSNCKDYEPRNKISGVCKHHTHWLYNHGDKIILRK